MKNTLVLLISTLFLLLSGSVLAQGPEGVEMADVMRSNGKIYVVVAVVAIVFAVITVYLISIDRKLRKLEKES
tara:strand:- start:381 stop:599 length:219 start_codon:yes stop_codon:yes gene_type:complete